MSLRSSLLSGSSDIRMAVTSSSSVERASTGASFSSSTSAVSRASSSASPVEYWRLVPVRDEVVFFLGKVLGIRYVGLDGDDTLWQNETRFQLTQTALPDLLPRHAPAAHADAHLADAEMRNLRIYVYGVTAFTLTMIESAIRHTDH